MRSAFAPIALVLIAVGAGLARWLMQGSGNFYSAFEKPFYVPGPADTWVISDERAVWIGLDSFGANLGALIALAVGGWFIRRRERKSGARSTKLRAIAWVFGGAQLVLPIFAFATGFGPEGGRDIRPQREAVVIDTASQPAPITGALELPAGRYEVVPNKVTEIAVRLKAGGDTFDARFAEGVTGSWRGDPKDLTKPMTAEVTALADQVDTGIGARTNHARDGYLKASKFPKLGWKLDQLVAARQEGPGKVVFRAKGTAELMGQTHPVEVTGSLTQADAAALTALGLAGSVLIAEADFSLVIKETALAPDAASFTGDRFPIHVSLVLRHAGEN